jgi:capsular exopolysaccharide synthesis family protein
MGRTHEALEWAEKKYKQTLMQSSKAPEKTVAAKKSGPFPMPAPSESERFQEVKTKLITRFADESVKTILITGTALGEGATFTAAGFATTLARDCRLKVLLIDANFRSPRLHEVFKIDYNQGLSNLLTREQDKPSLFKKVEHGDLYLIPCGGNHTGPLSLFESNRFDHYLKTVRDQFDYVILDSPPVNTYAESRVIAAKVDGVVLVVESGKTRNQVAIKAKQELEDAGAKILGVILNRRKHFIPNWIYKRL